MTVILTENIQSAIESELRKLILRLTMVLIDLLDNKLRILRHIVISSNYYIDTDEIQGFLLLLKIISS
mgnify:FL=1